ncbi:MAG: GNAT family N-acetyltransferase, partial [Alphaproteobacteria bacterium]|nr:GNAT family N-acetyltransferase [Alphaproteobacteria bacterium]
MKIRQARTADSDAIAAIYVDTWRDAYAGILPDRVLVNMSRRRQAADWRHALSHQSGAHQSGGHQILVAEAGEAGELGITGFGSCGPARDTGLAYLGEVFTLYVDPVHQGQGIGKALLAALFQALIRQGMASAVIWVLADNPAR